MLKTENFFFSHRSNELHFYWPNSAYPLILIGGKHLFPDFVKDISSNFTSVINSVYSIKNRHFIF